jgi:SAM-dependent methyltransferase
VNGDLPELTTPYDEIAAEYDDRLIRGDRKAQFVETIKTARVLLWAVSTPSRLVDLGCGTAIVSAPLLADGWDVLGLDASLAMLRIASHRITWTRHASATATGLDNASFPVALSTWTHGDIPWPAMIREVERILEPGGSFIYVAGNPNLDPHLTSGGRRRFRDRMGSKDLALGEIYEPFESDQWRIATRIYDHAAGQVWPVFGFRAERVES